MRFTLDGEGAWANQWRTGTGTGTGGVDVAQVVTVGPERRAYVSGSEGTITAPPEEWSPQGAFTIRIEAPELR
jgi:hypothetical protein